VSVDRVTQWRCHGRAVQPGTEVTIRGEHGRFRFLALCTNAEGRTWIDCYGGSPGREAFRSFAPDRVAAVHRLAKMRTEAQT